MMRTRVPLNHRSRPPGGGGSGSSSSPVTMTRTLTRRAAVAPSGGSGSRSSWFPPSLSLRLRGNGCAGENVGGGVCQRIRAQALPHRPIRGDGMANPATIRCQSCGRPHLDTLPCWRGSYAARKTAAVLARSRSCWMCGRVATTADHIKPRGQGGTDDADNLAPACVSCNSRRAHHRDGNPFTEDAPVELDVPRSPRWSR